MLCSLFTPVSASEQADAKLEKTVNLLEFFGILEDYDVKKIEYGVPVTRARFCSMFKSFIGDAEVCDTLYYHDVPRDHWAFNDIGVLTQRGIMKGVGNGYFAPDEPIARASAYKMFISLLGLDVQAETMGGYPDGYFKIAQAVGLLDGLSSSEQLTEVDMLYLFENALNCNMGTFEYSGGQMIYKIDEEKTLMSDIYDMYVKKGTVTSANGADLYGSLTLDDKYVIFDNKDKYMTDIDLFDYLGQKVEFIYYYDERTGDEPVVKHVISEKDNNVAELEITPDCSFDSGSMTLTYRGEGVSKKNYKLSTSLAIIYNGVYYTGDIFDVLDNGLLGDGRYTVKLIENNDNQGYDVAIVWEYENYVVGSVGNGDVVYDKADPTKTISIDAEDYESFEIYAGANEKDAEYIDADQVLSIYRSTDNKRIKIYVTKNTINGNIDSVGSDENYLVVDGESYYFKSAMTGIYRVGNEVELYLDKDGLIAYTKKGISEMQPGYFLEYKYDESSDTAAITVLKVDGQIEKIKLREKVNIDGNLRKDYIDMETDMGVNPQIILYQLDSDGAIRTIDTPLGSAKNSESKLELKTTGTSYYYRGGTLFEKQSANTKFNVDSAFDKFYVDDSTVFFYIPESLTSSNQRLMRDELLATNKKGFAGDTSKPYSVKTYGTADKELGAEQIVIITNDDALNQKTMNQAGILVEKVTQMLNSEDEVVYSIVGYRGGASTALECDSGYNPMTDNVTSGDIVIPIQDKNGLVTGVYAMVDYETISDATTAESGNNTLDSRKWTVGDAASRNGEYVLVEQTQSGVTKKEIFKFGSAPVLVYDATEPEMIRTGSINDIVTKEMNANCDKIFIHEHGLNMKLVVIYKD